jgi:hypothetical protein
MMIEGFVYFFIHVWLLGRLSLLMSHQLHALTLILVFSLLFFTIHVHATLLPRLTEV